MSDQGRAGHGGGAKSRAAHPATVQRKSASSGSAVQRKQAGPHPATVQRKSASSTSAVQRKQAGPHPATVQRKSSVQPKMADEGRSPHPATVQRKSQSSGSAVQRKASGPHPATLPRTGAAQPKMASAGTDADPSVIMMSKGNKEKVIKKLSDNLPMVAVTTLETNWGNLVTTPPTGLTLQSIGSGRASAFWSFEFDDGASWHIAYNTGTYNIAHVTAEGGGEIGKKTNYWFQVDKNRNNVVQIENADGKAFSGVKQAYGFSSIPSTYQAKIRSLLQTIYTGAI